MTKSNADRAVVTDKEIDEATESFCIILSKSSHSKIEIRKMFSNCINELLRKGIEVKE